MRGLLLTSLVGMFIVACGGAVDTSLGSGRSSATGAPGDPAGSSSGSASPRPACAIQTPVRHDFENGFVDAWGAANVAALRYDDVQPISGTTSLKLTLESPYVGSNKRAYFGRRFPASCALDLHLKLRTENLFESGSVTIVRLGATPASLDLVLGEHGVVSLVEEGPSGETEAHPIGSVAADETTAIFVSLDLGANRFEAAVAPVGAPLPERVQGPLVLENGDASDVVFGMWTATATQGSYWLDDFSLE